MPDLSQFYGSENFYRHGLVRNLIYTDGIKFLADEVGGYWFIDVVASYLHKPEVKAEPFQLWSIKLNGEGCIITMRADTNEPPVVEQEIPYTSFPENFECFCEANELGGHTLLLKSEH